MRVQAGDVESRLSRLPNSSILNGSWVAKGLGGGGGFTLFVRGPFSSGSFT